MDLKSNEPFWLVKNGIIDSYPSLKEDVECEVLFIGSGITGSLLAYQMVKEGYETNLIKEKFVNLKSTYAMVSEINPENLKKFDNTLFWNTDSSYIYMRTTDDGRLLIGGGDEDFKDPIKRDKLLYKKEKEVLKVLKNMQPDYQFYADFTWAGTFGETNDGLPYIGEHKKHPNSYFVLGFGGNGITFSVTGMEMALAFLKNKKHPLTEYFKFGR